MVPIKSTVQCSEMRVGDGEEAQPTSALVLYSCNYDSHWPHNSLQMTDQVTKPKQRQFS